MGSRHVQEMADTVPDQPNICSDGSTDPIPHLDVEVAGVGVFAHVPANIFDNKGRILGRLIQGSIISTCPEELLSELIRRAVEPSFLIKDGLLTGGRAPLKSPKVMEHADQAMVDDGTVRHEDFIGNDGADTAADLGRLRQQYEVISARRALFQSRRSLVHRRDGTSQIHVCNLSD